MYQVIKRNDTVVEFDLSKINIALKKAFEAVGKQYHESIIDFLALKVTADFESKIQDEKIAVEDIQDSVESVLIRAGYDDVAKAYILYRRQREKLRNMKSTILDYKELVDSYRTLPGREHTAIAGSSMGGLMSLYAVTCYNKVFSKAACLSPSLWTNPEKLTELIGKAKIHPETTVYMDYGSEELSNHPVQKEALMDMSRLLMEKNVNLAFRIIPGGNHSEARWEKQIPVFMDCLGL